jgi:hypothetical protein
VAEETFGGTPIEIRTGLKTVPPPRPRAPQTSPPKNETTTSLITVKPLNLRSLGTSPLLYFYLRCYSLFIIKRESVVIIGQMMINAEMMSQSGVVHF